MQVTKRCAALLLLLGLFGCKKPDYLEMVPREHTFRAPGEEVWWSVVAKTRRGQVIHKIQVTWSSADTRVVTVDEKGRVKAVGPGKTAVIARVGDVKAEALVEVVVLDHLTVEPEELRFEARGEPQKFSVRFLDSLNRPMNDRRYTARCRNEDVCRVGGDSVHPVDPGTTTLEVSSEGKSASLKVVVAAPGKGHKP